MSGSTAGERRAGGGRSLRVLRRLLREGRGALWSGYGALGCIVGETAVDTGVIPVLIALTFLTISPSPAALGAQVPAGSADWIQRLGWVGSGSASDRLRRLLLFVGLMLVAWLVKCTFSFGRSYLSERFAQGLIRELRQRLYSHLMRQALAFHRSRETGDLLSRVSNDVAVLQRVLRNDLPEAARSPITIIIAVALMASLEWRLTLLALACVPGVSLVIAHSGERLRRLTREVQRRLGGLNAYVQERLTGIETVQLFGMEEREVGRFRDINESNYRANMRVAAVVAVLVPLVELISAFGMLVLIYVAGYLTIKGPLSPATLIAFAYVGQRLGSKLGLLGKIWLSGQQAAAAGDRIFEILDAREEVVEAAEARELPRVRGEIAFRHVEFRYGDGEEVLRDVEVTIDAGQVVALVGASGAGKTSLVNLIPRFYDPSNGHIEIDGIDIAGVTLASLRSQIGIVPQEPILFSGSIRENIAYGKPEAGPEEIEAAARAANADDFIGELAEGYDTPVGERATKLSGGQRQRIAIARALLRDPRVLILDEATSALDAQSEALVQDALERLMEGRTTLIIAHRLSTIQRADRVLVLADGRIVEDGTHAELFRHGRTYRRLYEAQVRAGSGEAPASP
jgi:subfamily B ATP-binding cassette protein MsbA